MQTLRDLCCTPLALKRLGAQVSEIYKREVSFERRRQETFDAICTYMFQRPVVWNGGTPVLSKLAVSTRLTNSQVQAIL